MKKAFVAVGQFLLFLFIDAAGSLVYHPFHVETQLAGTPLAPRSFIWDGLILMVAVCVLLLVVQVFRRRLKASAPITSAALILAAIAGYMLRFGFVTHNW
jgi:hypothetical protein